MKKDNYIFIIGLIIGVLLSATGVYAVTQYTSNNIYYVNKNSTLSSNNVQGAIDELATIYKNKKIKEFSLGFRQRFGICQAIVGNPELIILDEPFNAIDEESISEISNILISQRNNGATILISSHDKDELRSICDYVYMLKNGEVIDLLKIDEF